MRRIIIGGLTLATLAACGGHDIEARWAGDTPDTATRVTLPAPATEPEEEFTLADFSIDLIVLEDQCFDTAGALVTVEPDVAIRGGSYDGEATLVYEVRGGEAVETYSIEIADGRYSYDKHLITTARCNATLTAVPTRLIER